MIEDTIAAVATPLGEGSIAVIRVSGPEAAEISEKVFRSRTKLTRAESHTVHYGFVVDPATGARIDEALATIMRAPRSYTAEDVVEISCHGGVVAARLVLNAVLDAGARLAEPGEFTKRAFLNGRIDLAQAEGVIDLIRSKSDRAYAAALNQAGGSFSRKVKELRQALIETLAHIEVNIDYPEHDVESLTNAYIKEQCVSVREKIEALLRAAEQGKLLREGIATAIVGKPNVGKSSLLNTLSRENRAIVTDIPGTTRDVIEQFVTVGGIALKLLDTAGIRETSDVVERIGVERSKEAIASSDLILFVVSGNEPLSAEERSLLKELEGRQMILIVNKMDLELKLDPDELARYVPPERIVRLSALQGEGLDRLERLISELFFEGELESGDLTYIGNSRHVQLLKRTLSALKDAVDGVDAGMPIDMVQIDVRNAWEMLGELIGEDVGESLIDQIFSQFCLGK